MIPRKTILVIV